MALAAEQAVNWASDPFGRISQIERHYRAAEQSVQHYVDALIDKSKAIYRLNANNHQQVTHAANRAYSGLEGVVAQLLRVDKGFARLSRQDEALVTTLKAVAEDFQTLEDVAELNNKELGVKAGDCKELGDAAGRLANSLDQRAQSMNAEAAAVLVQRNSTHAVWQGYHDDESKIQGRVDSFRRDAEGIGNSFASFFGSGDQAWTNLGNEEGRLKTNREKQRQQEDLKSNYEQLSTCAKNASASYVRQKQELQRQKAGFDDEYAKVTIARGVESSLWKGLLDLRNKINSTEYTSTRDRSLHQILGLLSMDDTVFMRQKFYEDAEARIKQAIQATLGGQKLTQLSAGIFDEPKEDAGEMDSI